jgi:hypothetical protein
MELDRYISRLSKILVESAGITFKEAQERLRALTLEIFVASDATSPAAHAAVLTAVSVGRRTFVGGVRVVGAVEQPLRSSLPISAATLGAAATIVGSSTFAGRASRRIIIGGCPKQDNDWSVHAWWKGWRAGATTTPQDVCESSENPLVGIAAGSMAVGVAFQAERGAFGGSDAEIDLWPVVDDLGTAPPFDNVYLPDAAWLVGIGNLGQAFLWAMTSLPYADPSLVRLVLQDFDEINEENWATSVLVEDDKFGELKTWVGERWARSKGFKVRRIDKRLLESDRIEKGDPRVALSGLDKLVPRRHLAKLGFDCIIDAGLGRTSAEFDRYRVTIFDQARPIDQHFSGANDAAATVDIPDHSSYRDLEQAIGRCGTVEIAGASAAAPYVSALAAAVAIARLVALSSGHQVPTSEVGKLSTLATRKIAQASATPSRAMGHAGRPVMRAGDKEVTTAVGAKTSEGIPELEGSQER